jgi:mono/diheme cytochrome c family protein
VLFGENKMKRPTNYILIIALSVFCLAAVVFSLSCSSGQQSGSTKTATSTQSPVTIALNGQQLFTKNCAGCHPSGPPDAPFSRQQMQAFIQDHHTGTGLNAAETAAIAAFLKP